MSTLRITVNGEHSNLWNDAINNGNARHWIIDPRGPSPTPPPPVVLTSTNIQGVPALPGTTRLGAPDLVGTYTHPAGDC